MMAKVGSWRSKAKAQSNDDKGEKYKIPTSENYTKNSISDIFRLFYKVHIRLVQKRITLS